MQESLKQRFLKVIPKVDFCSLRYVEERSETLTVRQNIAKPPLLRQEQGAMIMILDKGGLGYAATSDLSLSGLRQAVTQAYQWAQRTQKQAVVNFSHLDMPHHRGEYLSVVTQPWQSVSLADKLALLQQEAQLCRINDKIIDWQTSLWAIESQQWYLTQEGGEIYQHRHYLVPNIRVVAHHALETQYRTLGGHGCGQQGGLEILKDIDFFGKGQQLAQEALELLEAPNCPHDTLDLMLAPDQMALQIHESIGHPLELDRILGDERNYAGTSFVHLDMFGTYQYGSKLLNVTYDPTPQKELASYGFDDEGAPAEKTFLIQDGILIRPLGGMLSQMRAGLPGVANARASNWNRPPIDRMANLNLEPGESSFHDMLNNIERGIFMQSNLSWSIDDSRNKFQFGCEWGQLIENGELTQVVKNPNYRGISATFWRNLKQVGDPRTFEVFGVSYCGKGEPNQAVRVGHASPICVFANVEVFGGV